MGYDISKAGTLRLLLNGNLVSYANAVEQLGGEEYANDLEFGAVRADGKFYRMDQWREKTGIYEHTIRRRLKNGWSMLDAVNTPGSGWRCSPSDETRARTQGRPAKLFQCGDKALTLAQWASD